MPRNKFQGFIFGAIMAYAMAFGMEMYNTAINMGISLQPGTFTNMTWQVVATALKETAFMGLIVIATSSLFGNRAGTNFMQRHCREEDNPYFKQIMRQAGTVAVMCPTMSFIATVLFTILGNNVPLRMLPVAWFGTVVKNIPMAFFWNMFAAAPFTHWMFGLLFSEKKGSVIEKQTEELQLS